MTRKEFIGAYNVGYRDGKIEEYCPNDYDDIFNIEQEPCDNTIARILKRMWNCRGKHTTSIDKVKMEQIIRDELPSVKPQNDVLDKIRADIEQYQADCDLSCSDDANCRTCDRITFDTIYRIIDKYRKGDKE